MIENQSRKREKEQMVFTFQMLPTGNLENEQEAILPVNKEYDGTLCEDPSRLVMIWSSGGLHDRLLRLTYDSRHYQDSLRLTPSSLRLVQSSSELTNTPLILSKGHKYSMKKFLDSFRLPTTM